MKGIIVLILILINFSAIGQIKSYKITAPYYSHGVLINDPFYFCIKELSFEKIENSYKMNCITRTFPDTTFNKYVKLDSIPRFKRFTIDSVELTSRSNIELIEDYIKNDLVNFFGVNNVLDY